MISDEDLIRLRDQYPELNITRKVRLSAPLGLMLTEVRPLHLSNPRQTGKATLFAQLIENLKEGMNEKYPLGTRIDFGEEMRRLDEEMFNKGHRRGEMFNISYQYHPCAEMIWEEPEELPIAKKRRERNRFNGLNANGLPSAKAKRRGGR